MRGFNWLYNHYSAAFAPGIKNATYNVGPLQENVDWKPLDLTFVQYPRGNCVGEFLAFVSLSPLITIVSLLTLIASRRDLHTIALMLGITLNCCLNVLLKHIWKEPRPTAVPPRKESIFSTYGMPSEHSQFMWFFAIYLMLFIRVRVHRRSDSSTDSIIKELLLIGACILWAYTVGVARVYLDYNTSTQVLIGGGIGAVMGCVWFAITHLLLTRLFPSMCSWQICKFLLLRDMTSIPNVTVFEYNCAQKASEMAKSYNSKYARYNETAKLKSS